MCKSVDNVWITAPDVERSFLRAVLFFISQGEQGQVAFEERIVLRQQRICFIQGKTGPVVFFRRRRLGRDGNVQLSFLIHLQP